MLRSAHALAVLALLAGTPPALAQNEPFRITNASRVPGIELQVVRSGQTAWGANLLRQGPLAPGAFMALRPGEGNGCRFDIRLVLQTGQELVRRDADICTQRNVEMSADAAPVPGLGTGAQARGTDRPLPQVGGPDGVARGD